MIITISGMPGSGKDTCGKMLAKKLKYEFFCMGDVMREKAKARGMSLADFGKLCEKDKSIDKEVDEYQSELGKKKDNFVIVGRTSFHFIPESFKIFLDIDLDVAAKRILNAKRPEESGKSVEDIKNKIERRIKSETTRYGTYYDLDIYDKSQYDLIIDTTELSPEQVVKLLLDAVKTFKF